MTVTAEALIELARTARQGGDVEGALRHQRDAVEIRRRQGDRSQLAHALRHLADLSCEGGDHDAAGRLYDECLAIYRADVDAPPLDIANAIRSVACHAEQRGDLLRARALWEDARQRYAELDAVFLELTGAPGNPGVDEARSHLARLRSQSAL